jgi:hypothetical protein
MFSDICPLLSAPVFPIMIDHARKHGISHLSVIASQTRSAVFALKKAQTFCAVPKLPTSDHSCDVQIPPLCVHPV